ncbi:MAG: DUF3800 domain-containing protein [Azonexus sp.]|jgi:hypothetical protein|nr:DUF3800 domain-containing protein [Azonexus sp.]
MNAAENWSDTIIYVDESGDHSLESIDPEYPVFVLAFCIFRKDEYINTPTGLPMFWKANSTVTGGGTSRASD